jgi:hypothetical protein
MQICADATPTSGAVLPRWIGKTHFLTHDLSEQAGVRAWGTIYAALWGQADPLGTPSRPRSGTARRSLQTRAGALPSPASALSA